MSAGIVSQDGDKLTIQVEINLSGSMMDVEEKIQSVCNAVGALSTEQALKRFDADVSPIIIGKTKYTSRATDNKEYQTPYGSVNIKRHVYQDSSGGKIHAPLESAARIIHNATPRFAMMLSHKYASMSAPDTVNDLFCNHGRKISKNYLQTISDSVATVIDEKAAVWNYAIPALEEEITTVASSLDGAMLPTSTDGWRESMVGSISLYNKEGERQHTIYIGEAPQYGKEIFTRRMTEVIAKVKETYPGATHVGIADGARCNWPFLEKHTDKQVLDFYHVTEYLSKCAYAAFPAKSGKQDRIKEV